MATHKQKQKIFTVRPLYVILFFLLVFFVLAGVYLSQQTKLSSIEEEKAELQNQLNALTVEQERLERMLEYMQTNDYLLQYAREKLGYVYPDDFKFYDEETTNSVSGGSAIISNTVQPYETPTPYDVPVDDEDENVYYEPLPIG